MSATSGLILAAATVALVAAQFNDQGTGLQNQKDVDDALRLIELTTPTASKDEKDGVLARECGDKAVAAFAKQNRNCNNAAGADDNSVTECKCINDLATEVATLQIGITRKFIESFVPDALAGMQQLANNNNEFASNFNNAAQCRAQVDQRTDALGATAQAAVAAKCQQGNAAQLTAAATDAETGLRALVRAEEAKVNGNTAQLDQQLQFFQIAVIDNGVNKQNQNIDRQFSDLVQSAARKEKLIEAATLNSIAFTVNQIKERGWASYKGVAADGALLELLQGDKQLQGLLQEVAPKLAADAIFKEAIVDFNALGNKPSDKATLLKAAFEQANKRALKFNADNQNQQATVLLISAIDNDAAAIDLDKIVKAIMPAETVTKIAVDAADSKKRQLTIVSVSEAGLRSIINIDNEFALACVQNGLTCQVVEDVARNTFDAVQKANAVIAATQAPWHAPPPPAAYGGAPAPVADVDNGAASLVLAAAVSVVSALALFF